MKAKISRKQRVSRRFRLETSLPADLAMERLYELHNVEAPGLGQESSYQVSHERLGDTIYYEVRTLIKHGLVSKSQERIVTGEIRELDPTRTDVKGEFKKVGFRMYLPNALHGIYFMIALLLLWFAIWGPWLMFVVVLLSLIAISLVASILVNYRALDRAPTLERIKLCLEPRAEDRELIARRAEEHRLHLSQTAAALSIRNNRGSDTAAQARG